LTFDRVFELDDFPTPTAFNSKVQGRGDSPRTLGIKSNIRSNTERVPLGSFIILFSPKLPRLRLNLVQRRDGSTGVSFSSALY
jgi:hypothetical protein